MNNTPPKFIDTSLPGREGTRQLVEPANPEYVKHLLDSRGIKTYKEGMRIIMEDYKGGMNPAIADQIVKDYLKE